MHTTNQFTNKDNQIAGLEIDVTIIAGKKLIPKDRKYLGIGKANSSDPFVELYLGGKTYGKTQVIHKNLSPTWNKSFKIQLGSKDAQSVQQGRSGFQSLSLRIFDHDKISDDFMGVCIVPLILGKPPSTCWYKVSSKDRSLHCKNATGEVQVKLAIAERKVLDMVRGNSHRILCGSIDVVLQWHLNDKIDIDTSCVAIDRRNGDILMDETVYFGDLENSNKSIRHSGDAREGGREEVISCNLNNISYNVGALYFILTVATPEKVLGDVQSALVTVLDASYNFPICNFRPSLAGDYTSMFLMRIARDHSSGGGWIMTIIEDFDHTARDFGTLIPEIKGYSRDLIPGIKINPKERIAIMRKGGAIRLQDYSHGEEYLHNIVFGLAWDITEGRNIDLDASAICLNASLALVDIVSYHHLQSMDGAIIHGGDEREGDEKGDDEQIFINLDKLRPDVTYIGFVINSYSGQELDDIKKASCHLFNGNTRRDLASFKLSKDKALDGHTALVMACLYRCQFNNTWNLRVVGEAAQGRKAHELVDELQNFLHRVPPPQPAVVPQPEFVLNAIPDNVPIVEAFYIPP